MARAHPWGVCGACGKTIRQSTLPDKPGAPFLWGGVNEKGELHRCARETCPHRFKFKVGDVVRLKDDIAYRPLVVCRAPCRDNDPEPENESRLYDVLWLEMDGENGPTYPSAYCMVVREEEIVLIAGCRVPTWEGVDDIGRKHIWGEPAR